MLSEEKKYWRGWYLAVIIFLVLQILFFYYLSIHYNRG